MVLNNRERRVANLVYNTAVVTQNITKSGIGQWTNPASDPLSDMMTARTTIYNATGGYKPNAMVVGYDVFEAGDAAVALRLFEEEKPFHMLLCDVNLGVDNGMKLAEQIRMAQPSIRVLMLSGALLKEKDERAFSVLYKPFNQEEFRRAIDELRKEPT